MSATGPSSEHFGWPSFYEDSEAWWAAQERSRVERVERSKQEHFRRVVADLLNALTRRGLLREDRLSYTRICWLEHETGISTGSWSDYYTALREAEQKDRELWKSTT